MTVAVGQNEGSAVETHVTSFLFRSGKCHSCFRELGYSWMYDWDTFWQFASMDVCKNQTLI